MKGKKYLVAVAAVCVLLLGATALGGNNALLAVTLPFTAVGKGLRQLSLSGFGGNLIAIVLYVLLSLLPMVLLIRRKLHIEDLLIPLCSGVLFFTLYYMINPGLRPQLLSGDTGSLIYSGSVYSVLLAWLIVKLIRYCDTLGVSKIYRALRLFLLICSIECIWIGVISGFVGFRSDIAAVQEANTAPGVNLLLTHMFQALSFLFSALEFSLDAFVMFQGIRLLEALEQDPYAEACCGAADRTVRWCKISLTVIVLANMLLNLGQMFFAKYLHVLAADFRFPILSVAIVFAMLALTRLLGQGRELKEDNDLFI